MKSRDVHKYFPNLATIWNGEQIVITPEESQAWWKFKDRADELGAEVPLFIEWILNRRRLRRKKVSSRKE